MSTHPPPHSVRPGSHAEPPLPVLPVEPDPPAPPPPPELEVEPVCEPEEVVLLEVVEEVELSSPPHAGGNARMQIGTNQHRTVMGKPPRSRSRYFFGRHTSAAPGNSPRNEVWYATGMKRTIVVCGHGPGISDAVARRFGREGFAVALLARNAERLSAAAASLSSAGVTAKAFPCDLANLAATRAAIREAAAALGPVAAVHYNAYGGGAGDLTTARPDELRAAFDIAVTGLVSAVQEALADLRAQKGAVLVTGGGFAFYDPNIDAMATQFGAMGLAIGKAAQHKAVGLLRAKLAPEGVYVGEVVVLGMVKGTAFDNGQATLEASDIADRFWELHQRRAEGSVNFP